MKTARVIIGGILGCVFAWALFSLLLHLWYPPTWFGIVTAGILGWCCTSIGVSLWDPGKKKKE